MKSREHKKTEPEPDFAAAVGAAWRFGYDPANASDSLAEAVRLVLRRCTEQADELTQLRRLEVEVQRLRADNAAYAKRVDELRR